MSEREALVVRLGKLAGELSALASIQLVTGHLVERTLRSSAFCMRQAIAALTAQQEPVAWAEVDSEGRSIAAYLPGEKEQVEAEYGGVFRPLIYGEAAPQPADGVPVPRGREIENICRRAIGSLGSFDRSLQQHYESLLAAAKEPRR